jgi:hypothetical protein
MVMADNTIHQCACSFCRSRQDHPDQQYHNHLNILMSRLDEQQRRWLAALESRRAGYGGDTLLAQITGLHVDTIRRGREELDADLHDRPTDRVRKPGAGRPPAKKKTRPSLRTCGSSPSQSPAGTP